MDLCQTFHALPSAVLTEPVELLHLLEIRRLGQPSAERLGMVPERVGAAATAPTSSTGVGMSEREQWLRQLAAQAYTPAPADGGDSEMSDG